MRLSSSATLALRSRKLSKSRVRLDSSASLWRVRETAIDPMASATVTSTASPKSARTTLRFWPRALPLTLALTRAASSGDIFGVVKKVGKAQSLPIG